MLLRIASLLWLLGSLSAAVVGDDAAEAPAPRNYTVIEALGSPVPKASVVVTFKQRPQVPEGLDAPPAEKERADEALQTIKGMTDGQGMISIPQFDSRRLMAFARIQHPDYGMARCEVDALGGAMTLRVPLVRTGTAAHQRALKGTVVAPDGKPIAGAVVHCDSVRTAGEGLISPIYPLGDALTDEEGRFTCYLPNVNRDRQRGELIPPNSRYSLLVTGPEGESYFPAAGMFANGEPARIELPQPTRLHRLRFAAPGGGRIEDPKQLREIYVRYFSERSGDRAFVPLDTLSIFRGRRLPPGKYTAERLANGKLIRFRPVVIAPDSPAELVFQIPDPVTYHGRIVHGGTGKPMAGAFVMGWNGILHNNLALLSADDWKRLHELPAAPEVEDPPVQRLREFYAVQGLVRTNAEGHFEIMQQSDQEFYGVMAFEEDFVPFKVRTASLRPGGQDQRVEAGEFPLFPAAKVLVRPVFDGQQLAVSPKWLPAATTPLEWIERFRSAGLGTDREFEYVHWLKLNQLQPVYVPAGVRMRMRLEAPYNDEWAPGVVELPMPVEHRATFEVGDVHFAAGLAASVRVVDRNGNPVEGAPVRRTYDESRAWSVAHNTDKEGLAHFHLHPGSRGKFRVMEFPGGVRIDDAKNLVTQFEVGDQPPAKPFEITLTDDQARLMRGDGNSKPKDAR
jgi:hypothetical protein